MAKFRLMLHPERSTKWQHVLKKLNAGGYEVNSFEYHLLSKVTAPGQHDGVECTEAEGMLFREWVARERLHDSVEVFPLVFEA